MFCTQDRNRFWSVCNHGARQLWKISCSLGIMQASFLAVHRTLVTGPTNSLVMALLPPPRPLPPCQKLGTGI